MGEGIATISDLTSLFENTVSVVLALGGFVLFIMLLSGGFKYVTSGGNPEKVEGAKKTLTYAISGLVVLLFSFLILQIIEDITGAKVTEFDVFRN